MTPRNKTPLIAAATLALAGCDAATQAAGDAIKEEIRAQFIAQCEQVAQDNGIASTNISTACDCSADAFAEEVADGELQVDPARIEEVLKTCVQASPDASGDTASEATNG